MQTIEKIKVKLDSFTENDDEANNNKLLLIKFQTISNNSKEFS